jgi:hypothetical protein
MGNNAVITPTPEAATAPVPGAPPKRRPKLTAEQRELMVFLRQEAPHEPLRWGICAGTEKEPHPEGLFITYLDPGSCPACYRPVQTALLEANGGNGPNQGK